jgi:hypothetical protein
LALTPGTRLEVYEVIAPRRGLAEAKRMRCR